MKKYVKPMMESEAFVANEYISACTLIDCTNCDGSLIVQNGSFNYPIISQGDHGQSTLYAYVGELKNGTNGNGCVRIEDDGIPQWIEDISNSSSPLYLRAWEGLVLLGYWIFVGINPTVDQYHPVNITDMKNIPGERHPNHS